MGEPKPKPPLNHFLFHSNGRVAHSIALLLSAIFVKSAPPKECTFGSPGKTQTWLHSYTASNKGNSSKASLVVPISIVYGYTCEHYTV